MKTYKKDNRYTYKRRENSAWHEVHIDGKFHALVMNEETARQVIHREIVAECGMCDFLEDEDFE